MKIIDEMMTAKEAAAVLGIGEQSLRNRLYRKCPILQRMTVKILGRRYFRRAAVAAYLATAMAGKKAESGGSRPKSLKNDLERSGRDAKRDSEKPTPGQGGR